MLPLSLFNIGLTGVGVAVLQRLSPGDIPRLEEAGLDTTVLAFALSVAVLAGLLLGLVPVFRAAQGAPRAFLGEGDRTAGTLISRYVDQPVRRVSRCAVSAGAPCQPVRHVGRCRVPADRHGAGSRTRVR